MGLQHHRNLSCSESSPVMKPSMRITSCAPVDAYIPDVVRLVQVISAVSALRDRAMGARFYSHWPDPES